VRKKIRGVDLTLLGAANFLDAELNSRAVVLDPSLNFHEIIALEGGSAPLEPVPHPGFDAARGVAELQSKVGFALPRDAHFLFTDEKMGGDGLAVFEARDENLLHDFFLGRGNHLRPDFFCDLSLLSGVGATSSMAPASFTAAVSVYPGLICR
jgi:hypothetical protein